MQEIAVFDSLFKFISAKTCMKDKYMTELAWVSLVFIIVGVALWLFGDMAWAGAYVSMGAWYVLVYGGVFLIAIGTIEWAYLSRKAKLI